MVTPTPAQELRGAIDDFNRNPFAQLLKGTGLTCQHCGYRDGVILRQNYVGGTGYVQISECLDRIACWGRYDSHNAGETQGKRASQPK